MHQEAIGDANKGVEAVSPERQEMLSAAMEGLSYKLLPALPVEGEQTQTQFQAGSDTVSSQIELAPWDDTDVQAGTANAGGGAKNQIGSAHLGDGQAEGALKLSDDKYKSDDRRRDGGEGRGGGGRKLQSASLHSRVGVRELGVYRDLGTFPIRNPGPGALCAFRACMCKIYLWTPEL